MHRQLLARELMSFTGDKELLCEQLWNESNNFHENMAVALVQFITMVSESFCEKFLPILQDTSVNKEVRIAIIRYFGKHRYVPAQDVLIDFVENSEDVSFAIVSATALRRYHSPSTIAALEKALSDPDWYVRFNASATLVVLGNEMELAEVLRSDNVQKREIVAYIIAQEKALGTAEYSSKREGEREIA